MKMGNRLLALTRLRLESTMLSIWLFALRVHLPSLSMSYSSLRHCVQKLGLPSRLGFELRRQSCWAWCSIALKGSQYRSTGAAPAWNCNTLFPQSSRQLKITIEKHSQSASSGSSVVLNQDSSTKQCIRLNHWQTRIWRLALGPMLGDTCKSK